MLSHSAVQLFCDAMDYSTPGSSVHGIFRVRILCKVPILWPLGAKSWLMGKDPDAGKDWGQDEKEVTTIWSDGIINTMDVSLSKLREIVKDRQAWHATVRGVAKSQTHLSHSTTTRILEWAAVSSFQGSSWLRDGLLHWEGGSLPLHYLGSSYINYTTIYKQTKKRL